MHELFIDKKITIRSPVPKAWKVLVKKQYIEQWISEFSKGNIVTEDWHLDRQLAMTDNDGAVLMEGTITEFKPNRRLKIDFEHGNYTEDLTLAAQGNETWISIHAGPVAHADYQMHSEIWEKGLNKIKELAEAIAD